MHKTKADCLRQYFPEKDCFSAITMIELDRMTVGSPVMISMKPFVQGPPPQMFNRHGAQPGSIALRPGSISSSSSAQPRLSGARHEDIRNKDLPAPSYPKKLIPIEEDTKKVSVKDLYEMGVAEANKALQNVMKKVSAMSVFSFYQGLHDFHQHTMHGHQVYFDGKKPLIFDKGRRFELERLSDVHEKGDLNNFSEMIYHSLKENRYINYSFGGVSASNKRYMFEDINIIFSNLKEVFHKNFSFFTSLLSDGTLRALVDTVSISFYRMQDIVAIFDSKKTSGIGAEIFLTNSAHRPVNMEQAETTATYRFLFSKSKENILTIDGELIHRQCNRFTGDALGSALSVINKNVPIDDKSKKNKAKITSV